MLPVTTLEEIPVLSEQERAALAKSLKQAEARINPEKESSTVPSVSGTA
jgi:hypothetical protein